jgi:hypothetical protein
LATARFGAPPAEREPDAEAGSIGGALLERGDEVLSLPRARQPSTFVPNVDENAISTGANV